MAQSKIALAGASGFVGTSLRIALAHKYRWIALTRSETRARHPEARDNTEWRHCDLFSLPQVKSALEGADKAVYLVHSMLPSSRLSQGDFRDLDLLLADNFIRAAEAAGVRQVVYLGGLIPEKPGSAGLSPHLASRLEVEQILRSRSVPVTVLRAGLVFGRGGSSTRMLLNLVRRLPVMILPAWTNRRTQSIDIQDAIRAIDLCLDGPFAADTYDIAGHPPTTYRELILQTADLLGRRLRTIPIPVNSFQLSRLWVSLFSGLPRNLVGPLLESLQHDLEARPNPLLDALKPEARSFKESVSAAVDPSGQPLPNPRQQTQGSDKRMLHQARTVRSVQRMPLPHGWQAPDLLNAYGRWIHGASLGLIRERFENNGAFDLFLLRPDWVLLRFIPTPFSRDSQWRRAFYIGAGLLAGKAEPPGRFELRIFPDQDCLIAAIHGYVPRLPWWIYAGSQALVHLAVMHGFSRHLARQSRQHAKPPNPPGKP